MGNGSENSTFIRHKEFIGLVTSTTDFQNRVYHINPGLDGAFPWLANIAENFQRYRMQGMVAVFESTLSTGFATFASFGSLAIAADLNPAADPAASQLELEQMQFCASAKPSESIIAPIECSPRQGAANGLCIRTGDVPTGSSINDYDHCKLQVATTGQPSDGVVLGKLYIDYCVELMLPKSLGPGGRIQDAYHIGSAASNAAPFGTTNTEQFDTIGCTLTPTTLTLPVGSAGVWEVSCDYVGTAASLSAPTVTYTSGCAAGPTLYSGGTVTKLITPPSASNTTANFKFTVAVTDNATPAVVTLSGGVVPTSATVDVYVKQVNPRYAGT
jgi:hypothetical protein